MISLSHAGTIKLLNNMCDSYDAEALVWSDGQKDHFEVNISMLYIMHLYVYITKTFT